VSGPSFILCPMPERRRARALLRAFVVFGELAARIADLLAQPACDLLIDGEHAVILEPVAAQPPCPARLDDPGPPQQREMLRRVIDADAHVLGEAGHGDLTLGSSASTRLIRAGWASTSKRRPTRSATAPVIGRRRLTPQRSSEASGG